MGLIAIVGLAWASGSLTGWLEIIAYNREYAQIRGSIPEGPWIERPGAIVQTYFQDFANLGRDQFFYLSSLALASGVLFYLWKPWRHRPEHSRISTQPVSAAVLVSGFTLGALLVTLSQRPALHHWQYAVAPLCLLMVVMWANARNSGVLSSLTKSAVGVLLLLLPLAVAVHFNRSLPLAVTPNVLASWRYLDDGAVLTSELAGLKPGTEIAVFGINSIRVDYAAMPQDVQLKCRFFYQYNHLLPRYREEIESCRNADPDVVVVQDADWADDAVRSSIGDWLTADYIPCLNDPTAYYQVWGRDQGFCPAP